MKLSTSIFIGILSLFVSLTSCGRGQQHTQSVDTILERDSIDFNFPVTVEYAHGFTVANHPGYKELVMYKPGTRDTVADYILYPRSSEQPRVAHPQAVYIPVPARNLATSSSPHVGAVAVLGLQHVLVAVSDPEKVNDSLTRRRIQEGKVQRIGRGMSKDIERIIALNPDIYLQDLYSGTEKDTDLVASGINIVYFNNWKEQDMLGRAEWLKVIGLLYGRNAVADSASVKWLLIIREQPSRLRELLKLYLSCMGWTIRASGTCQANTHTLSKPSLMQPSAVTLSQGK